MGRRFHRPGRRRKGKAWNSPIVYSAHVNDVAPSLLTKAQQDLLKADGAQLGYGPPVGFVVKFTNGLGAYLSSDTAVFGDMKTVISDFHKASLAVINLGAKPGPLPVRRVRHQ